MLSAWQRGVREYAEELLGQARSNGIKGRPTAKQLLNGAANWREYSFGGCALILSGEYTDDTLDAIKENKKFPQHQYRAVVGFIDHPTKIAYFMAEYRAKDWAERARAIADDRFAGYQIQRRANDTYIIKEDKR